MSEAAITGGKEIVERGLDVEEQIRLFREFIEQNYYAQLLEQARKGNTFLVVDFARLLAFNNELAELFLESPEDLLKAAELAVKEFDIKITKFHIRFHNLPESQKLNISDIRSSHLNKFIWTEGIVRQKSDVRPHVTAAKFECPSCGNIITMFQPDKKFKEPSRCGCGRKGKFREISKELVDAQGLVLEEAADELDGSQPKRLNIFLKDDLVSPLSERKSSPGSRVRAFGMVTEVPIILRTGGQATKYDLIIQANYVEPVYDEELYKSINDEEISEFKEIAAHPHVLRSLAESIAPSIYGHEKIKEALVLQLAGGSRKVHPDGISTRGDSHILLVGDPGSAKSQLLKRIAKVGPKSKYTSGKGATAAGLTAAVVKDEFLGGWSLEAGALVLANRGFAIIDEMDKMGKDDRSALHEAMEQQQISISKANIQATLRCETSIIAACNPKFGRFNPYGIIADQIDLPPALLSRFDLIFPIKDLPNREQDDQVASFILNIHKDPESIAAAISTEVLKKYFSYIRQHINPHMSDAAIGAIKEYYISMRSSGTVEEGGVPTVPITPRQLEALVRLSEAHARLRMSNIVSEEDAHVAIELLGYCLNQIAMDRETGKIDIDRLGGGFTAKQRGDIVILKEIIISLAEQSGSKTVSVEEITRAAQEKNITDSRVTEGLEKLRRSGDIYEPKRGYVQKL